MLGEVDRKPADVVGIMVGSRRSNDDDAREGEPVDEQQGEFCSGEAVGRGMARDGILWVGL